MGASSTWNLRFEPKKHLVFCWKPGWEWGSTPALDVPSQEYCDDITYRIHLTPPDPSRPLHQQTTTWKNTSLNFFEILGTCYVKKTALLVFSFLSPRLLHTSTTPLPPAPENGKRTGRPVLNPSGGASSGSKTTSPPWLRLSEVSKSSGPDCFDYRTPGDGS